jgi:hypothetical protein
LENVESVCEIRPGFIAYTMMWRRRRRRRRKRRRQINIFKDCVKRSCFFWND